MNYLFGLSVFVFPFYVSKFRFVWAYCALHNAKIQISLILPPCWLINVIYKYK